MMAVRFLENHFSACIAALLLPPAATVSDSVGDFLFHPVSRKPDSEQVGLPCVGRSGKCKNGRKQLDFRLPFVIP